MESTDKVYLLMDILGHNISKEKDRRHAEILDSKEYHDVYKQLWMMRVQQGNVAQSIATRVEVLEKMPIDTFQDVMTLAQEIETITLKGNEVIVINPYIYNYYRQYNIKTIGEMKIPYAKTEIDINEYIMGAEIAAEKKIRFLTNVANDWYAIASNDLNAGIEKTTQNLHSLAEVKRFRFPFFATAKYLILVCLLILISQILFSKNSLFINIRMNTIQNDVLGAVLVYSFLGISVISFLLIAIMHAKGKHFHRNINNTLYVNLSKYQKLLSKLALKHRVLLNAIEKAVNDKTFLRMSFMLSGVITPATYAFDTYDYDKALISKEEYNKNHKWVLWVSIISLIVVTILMVVITLKILEVF